MTRAMLIGMIAAIVLPHVSDVGRQTAPAGAVFVAYYWRAKPGQLDAYTDYIKTVAVPIDEDARKAGVFEEVHTVTPAPGIVRSTRVGGMPMIEYVFKSGQRLYRFSGFPTDSPVAGTFDSIVESLTLPQ